MQDCDLITFISCKLLITKILGSQNLIFQFTLRKKILIKDFFSEANEKKYSLLE